MADQAQELPAVVDPDPVIGRGRAARLLLTKPAVGNWPLISVANAAPMVDIAVHLVWAA